MNLTEAERLVRRIELYLKQPDASLQPDVMAQEYAAVHASATKRLITCQRIIRNGDRAQALQLAETPPSVIGLINCLEFRKARDWVSLCRERGWKAPEPVDREAVRTLQEAYAEGVKGDHDFFRKYRGAVMRRNWQGAYEALQSILKVQPDDQGYLKEANRLRKQILDDLMKPLAQAVDEGDLDEVLLISGKIESLPFVAFQPDANNTVWAKAQCMRCEQLIERGQQHRSSNNWREVLSQVGRVKDLLAQYGVALSTELTGKLSDLSDWAVAEQQEYDQQQKHDSLIKEELHLLQQAEEKQTSRTKPLLEEQKQELETMARKWREIEQTGRAVPEELQDKYQRNSALLRGQVARSHRVRRNLMLLAAVVALIVVAVAGFFVMEARNAGSMAAQLEELMEARKVRASEALAKSIREKHPRLVEHTKLSAALGQVGPFCEKERDANQALLAKIEGVSKWAEASFEDPSLQEIQNEIDACKAGVENLAEDFKEDTGSALAAVQNEWELHLDTLGGRRNTEFSALLSSAEGNVATLKYDLPPARAAEDLKRLSQPVKRMEELIPANLSMMKIKDESVERFGLLTNRLKQIERELNAWQSGRTSMREAEDITEYLKGLETIGASKFVTSKQDSALSSALSVEMDLDKLLQPLLMPGQENMWKRFTENQGLQTSPKKLMPKETDLLVTLLRDRNLKGVKLGRIQEVEYVDLRPVKKAWTPVFVFGGTGKWSNQSINEARARGDKVEVVPFRGNRTQLLEWVTIYDPKKFPEKLTYEYRNLSGQKLNFEYIKEEGNEDPLSPPEIQLLNRVGISELITGYGDKISGEYSAMPGIKGVLTIYDNGRCSLVGDDFPGGNGSWRREGVSLKFTFFEPSENQTTRYTMDWMGNSLIAHYVYGRSDFTEKFGKMSREMLTFKRTGTDGGHITAPVSITKAMDAIISDKESENLFKLYLLRFLWNISALRHEEWDTAWLPKSLIEKLRKELIIPPMAFSDGMWMVPALKKMEGMTLFEESLAFYKSISLEHTAKLAHQVVRKPYDTGFSIAGFVELDHEGNDQLYLSEPTTKRLWGWNESGEPGKLFTWDSEKKSHIEVEKAMPFTPIYVFNGDSSSIKAALLDDNKTGYSNEAIEEMFPPLYKE